MPSTRRTFLKQTAATTCLATAGTSGAVEAEQKVKAPSPPDLRSTHSGPHLFLDDYLIAEQSNLKREAARPHRLQEPVITGPEDKCFQPYVTVVQDTKSKQFRVWYGVPENASQSHVATMESVDGIHWKRPHRVLEDPGHIQFGVSMIDEGPQFSQPEHRYKYAYWHDGGLHIATSSDGLRWKKLAPGPVLKHNHDINNIYYDPIRKHYVANVSMYLTDKAWSGQRRVTYQSESNDLLHWSEPHRIVAPDAQDEGETQFYCMGGVLARGEMLIGMARVLRDDLPAEPGGPVAGLGYTQLTYSRDGQTWTRERTPFLDRNEQSGKWDRAMTWVDCQLHVGEEIYCYYGGYKRGHKVERFTERQIGMAWMYVDRYVARTADAATGTLLTHPIRFAGKRLTVNAKVRGKLQVAVLQADGRPIPGYASEKCIAITGDNVEHEVQWKPTSASLQGKPVRLKFTFSEGQLFAFDFVK